jgi:hypothetical protein
MSQISGRSRSSAARSMRVNGHWGKRSSENRRPCGNAGPGVVGSAGGRLQGRPVTELFVPFGRLEFGLAQARIREPWNVADVVGLGVLRDAKALSGILVPRRRGGFTATCRVGADRVARNRFVPQHLDWLGLAMRSCELRLIFVS